MMGALGAVAITGIVTFATMALIQQQMGASQWTEARAAAQSIENQYNMISGESALCKKAFSAGQQRLEPSRKSQFLAIEFDDLKLPKSGAIKGGGPLEQAQIEVGEMTHIRTLAGEALYLAPVSLKVKTRGSSAGPTDLRERMLSPTYFVLDAASKTLKDCFNKRSAGSLCVEIGGVYDETKTPSCQVKTGECRPVVEGKPWLRRNIVCTVKRGGSYTRGDQVAMELTGWGPGVGVVYRHGGFGDKSPLGIKYSYEDGRFLDHDENDALGGGPRLLPAQREPEGDRGVARE